MGPTDLGLSDALKAETNEKSHSTKLWLGRTTSSTPSTVLRLAKQ